jgi:hypothetical protein
MCQKKGIDRRGGDLNTQEHNIEVVNRKGSREAIDELDALIGEAIKDREFHGEVSVSVTVKAGRIIIVRPRKEQTIRV